MVFLPEYDMSREDYIVCKLEVNHPTRCNSVVAERQAFRFIVIVRMSFTGLLNLGLYIFKTFPVLKLSFCH